MVQGAPILHMPFIAVLKGAIMQNGRSGLCAAALVSVSLLWAGMLIGVSWIATPVKFAAPSLTTPVALEVGRVTFHLFNTIEWALAILLLIVAFINRARGGMPLLFAAVIAVLVLLQTVWLLPLLDERVAIVIAGGTPPASSLHLWYIIIEAVKLLLLIAIGLIGLARKPATAP
jgi:hypothetical protein